VLSANNSDISTFNYKEFMNKLAAIWIATVCFAGYASAKCDKDDKTIFSCLTGRGKVIEVCDAGKTIRYSFGFPNAKPEIVVTVPRSKASTSQ
jgi:hypothetical protein